MEGLPEAYRPDDSRGPIGSPRRSSGPDLRIVDHNKAPARSRRRFIAAVILSLICGVIGGFIGGLALPYVFGSDPINVYRSRVGTSAERQLIKVDGKIPVSPVTAVAQKLEPSIVNIRTKQDRGSANRGDARGVGSGVIIRSDGFIVTNLHVVEEASEIWVTVGGDDVRGVIIGTDKDSDLAVIKVPLSGLTPAEVGSSKALRVGDLVVAMGSPFGFEHTVTSGIVSGLRRTVNLPERDSGGPRTYANMIQTDAPINPGNSGGALADIYGKVVGINALIMSNSGVNEGIGFAIPIETVMSVTEELINKGKASHPYMGILGQNVEPGSGEDKNALPSEKKGALVVDVVEGSPASKAGLRKGDVITSINGKRIESMDDLMNEVRQHKVGEKLRFSFLRGGKAESGELVLIDKPPD